MNDPIVFGTSNSKDRLSKPLLSRFQTYYLPEYTDEEFILVSEHLLSSKYNFTPSISNMIAEKLLLNNEKDVAKYSKLPNW